MKKRIVRFGVGLMVITGVILSGTGWAEDQKSVSLGEIVVTATKTEKEAEDAPGSVSIVTQEDIKERNIQVVGQAVNDLAGVYDRRSTGLLDPISWIQIRGLPGSQRTLLMLDGISLNDPYSGGQKDLLGGGPRERGAGRGGERPLFQPLRRLRHGWCRERHHENP